MDEIPEDVRRDAEAVCHELFRTGPFRAAPVPLDPQAIVARAILAERERCADLVEALADANEAQSALAVLSEAVSAIRRPTSSAG